MAKRTASSARVVALTEADEDGFRVANAHGGLSIQIGTRLPTDARARIPSVPDLHRWLADMADRLR